MRAHEPGLDRSPALAGFGRATRAWFERSFGAPTRVQAEGWPAILRGEHALLCAPTGSGKTLAAFLACLDRLLHREQQADGVRVVYVSPLKALAYDVEKNLERPLAGIMAAASDEALRPIRVATRTGDTPPRERRRLGRDPADVLITTPESLYLLLGSEARRILSGVETIIVDEIHAVAGTKRGAHLALSLERLAELVRSQGGADPQRVGLSATQRPLEEVARFLGGARAVTIVDAGEPPRLDLVIEVPVEALERPEPVNVTGVTVDAAVAAAHSGVWPALHARVLELIVAHRSTLVFCNSRRLCERVAQRLNELWNEAGHEGVLVRAHHGSIAREKRVEIETLLKEGRLRGLVATSSLELGIDMGAIDLVVQIESPGAVSRGLQRVGRAGHAVGERSQARIFPKLRQDLLEATVVARRMLEGEVEPIRVPRNPLDVLAQQIVAITGERARTVDELETLARAAYPFSTLSRELLVSVLDMLAGRYPSNELGDLRPRVVWDRATDLITARKDARLVAIVNAGTIPDRGLYGVYLESGGPRIGELDEEMVHESRVGQTFLLGASSWRIVEIERDRVIVRPAPGEPGRMPFWRGEGPGRPIELGRALGGFLRQLEGEADGGVERRLESEYRLEPRAARNLHRYLDEQRQATGRLPTDRTLIIERFRDELGDWRVCLLSPLGARVHAPLALALESVLAERTGVEVQTLYTDDGIVLRLADAESPPNLADLLPDPEALDELLLGQLRHSSLFASHFRENAARALLLPRRRPGQRTPLWSQRQKAQALLAVAGQHPSFPIVLETYRECLNDVFDVPALRELLGAIRSGTVRVVEVETTQPSPFARGLAFAYVAAYLYEGDAPLAERKAQALTLDRALLRELLGEVELRELLDPDVLAGVEAELQGLAPDRRARSADSLHDLLRRIGDLSDEEIAARTDGAAAAMLEELSRTDRIATLTIAGRRRRIAVEDSGQYVSALGVPPPPVPAIHLAPAPDPLEGLVHRYARTHGPFSIEALAGRFGLSPGALAPAIRRLVETGRLLEGEFRPDGVGEELCEPEILRRLRRQTLAALRRAIAPVDDRAFVRFLLDWHGLGRARPRGRASAASVREALRFLEGLALPFDELEAQILPCRLPGYEPRFLDELGAAGEIVWVGRSEADGGRIALYFRDHVDRLLDAPAPVELSPLAARLLDHLAERGAAFFAQLQTAAPTALTAEVEAALWELVWAGQLTNDTFAPLRTLGRTRPAARRGTARTTTTMGGRWSRVAELSRSVAAPTEQAHARAHMLLQRHGILTREVTALEDLPGGFSSIAPVLRAMEESGRVRRGYFVEGLSGAQYALPSALDRLRSCAEDVAPRAVALSAIDPANPFGISVDWPALASGDGVASRPRRVAGATVVIVGASPVLFLEKGGRSMSLFATPDGAEPLSAAVACLRELVNARRRPLQIAEINGRPALRSPFASALEKLGFRVEPGALVLDPA